MFPLEDKKIEKNKSIKKIIGLVEGDPRKPFAAVSSVTSEESHWVTEKRLGREKMGKGGMSQDGDGRGEGEENMAAGFLGLTTSRSNLSSSLLLVIILLSLFFNITWYDEIAVLEFDVFFFIYLD